MGRLHWHGHGAFPSIGEPGGQLLPAAKPGGRLGAKGCRHSVSTRPEAAEGTTHAVVSCPPENYRRALTERGVHRGFSPYAHSLVTFSCGRESHPSGVSPPPPQAAKCSLGTFPGARESTSPSGETKRGLEVKPPANIERPFDFSLPMGYTKGKGGKGPWTG